MSTYVPFADRQAQPELSLRRRIRSPRSLFESESYSPFSSTEDETPGHAALQAAWDKLYRARAILEREQCHLRDDRIALQGELEAIEAREQAVASRELRIQQLEMQAALDLEEKQEEEDSRSTLSKLTRAPFDMARSVFGQRH